MIINGRVRCIHDGTWKECDVSSQVFSDDDSTEINCKIRRVVIPLPTLSAESTQNMTN
jgi:hypothetical protein